MGIFKKFSDIVKSSLNQVLDHAEKPEFDLKEKRKIANNLLISTMARLNLAKKQQPDNHEEIRILEQSIDILKQSILAINNKLNNLASNIINNPTAFDAFERMENKIVDQENYITALTELLDKLDPKALEQELRDLAKKTSSSKD